MSNPDVKAALTPVLVQHITAANAHAARVSASTVNVGKLVNEIRKDDTSGDAVVQAFQAWYEQANAAIEAKVAEVDAYIKANLVVQPNAGVDLDAERAAYKASKAQVDAAMAVLTGMGVTFAEGELPVLNSLRSPARAAEAAGDGPKRPRFANVAVNGTDVTREVTLKDGSVKRTSNLTLAAAYIAADSGEKCKPSDIGAAVFETAGTDDLKTVPGRTFEVVVNSGEKSYTVTVQTPEPDAAAE